MSKLLALYVKIIVFDDQGWFQSIRAPDYTHMFVYQPCSMHLDVHFGVKDIIRH
jgi:hypothetical protein